MLRPSSMSRALDRLRGRRWLVAVCVGVAMGETLLVSSLLSASSVALATQASAPPPFDLFHDLRWLVVYHESWFGFAFELLLVLLLRSVLLTVLVRAAWPRDVVPEPLAVRPHLLPEPWVGLAVHGVLPPVGQEPPRAVGQGGVHEDERRPGPRAVEGGDRALEAGGGVVAREPVEDAALEVPPAPQRAGRRPGVEVLPRAVDRREPRAEVGGKQEVLGDDGHPRQHATLRVTHNTGDFAGVALRGDGTRKCDGQHSRKEQTHEPAAILERPTGVHSEGSSVLWRW